MHHHVRTALLVLVAAATGAAAAFACGCGGSAPAPADTALVTTSPHPTDRPSPPASTEAPLLEIGEPAAFFLPDGGVITVTGDEFTDPATTEDGIAAGAGERLVSLKLVVRAEETAGASGATITLRFKESSFLLVAADDSLYTPIALAAELAAGRWKPASSTGFDVVFSVRDTAELVRFVCTPGGDVTPRSATWLLK
jgi:hypothetical protein